MEHRAYTNDLTDEQWELLEPFMPPILKWCRPRTHSYRELLNVRKHGLFAVQVISHKLLRYFMPVVLAAAFASNALLASSSTAYEIAFLGQVAFYLMALAGAIVDRLGGNAGPLALPYYFILANAAALVALVRFARGDRFVTWARTRDADD